MKTDNIEIYNMPALNKLSVQLIHGMNKFPI